MTGRPIRSMPCQFCPYRKDCPSGVWAVEEYDKLEEYDQLTPNQPMGGFACHATPEHYCHGWAIVHTFRGHEFELLSLRIWASGVEIPKPGVPLFESGHEAAEHGRADLDEPGDDATGAIDRLLTKYERFQDKYEENRF